MIAPTTNQIKPLKLLLLLLKLLLFSLKSVKDAGFMSGAEDLEIVLECIEVSFSFDESTKTFSTLISLLFDSKFFFVVSSAFKAIRLIKSLSSWVIGSHLDVDNKLTTLPHSLHSQFLDFFARILRSSEEYSKDPMAPFPGEDMNAINAKRAVLIDQDGCQVSG